MTAEQLALIQQWHAAKQQLASAEAFERELRSAVVKAMFGDYGDGSRNANIGNGYTLNNVNTTTYDVKDAPELRKLVQNFASYEATADIGRKLIKDKPRLSVSAYKALPQWGTALMVPFVTMRPQLPQLKIIAPES